MYWKGDSNEMMELVLQALVSKGQKIAGQFSWNFQIYPLHAFDHCGVESSRLNTCRCLRVRQQHASGDYAGPDASIISNYFQVVGNGNRGLRMIETSKHLDGLFSIEVMI